MSDNIKKQRIIAPTTFCGQRSWNTHILTYFEERCEICGVMWNHGLENCSPFEQLNDNTGWYNLHGEGHTCVVRHYYYQNIEYSKIRYPGP